MKEPSLPGIPRWPFFAGDVLLLGLAGFVCARSSTPLGVWEILLYFCCVSLGATLGILPYVLEFQTASRLAETEGLSDVVQQIRRIEEVAAKIADATAHWQTVQDSADKTRAAAKEITDRIESEAQEFGEFMKHANDTEKATLRLEVEKLRRAEHDLLQVPVRMLDHVYALRQGAVLSGKPALIEQITHFQNACRDAARRIGLVPFVAGPEEVFDERRHCVADSKTAAPGAHISETVATGYTFQGQLLRPALVRLSETEPSSAGTLPAEPVASTGEVGA